MREMAKRMKGRRNPFLLLKTVMELFHRPCDILFSNATLLEVGGLAGEPGDGRGAAVETSGRSRPRLEPTETRAAALQLP